MFGFTKMRNLLPVLLVGTCSVGDFCEVVPGPLDFHADTARQIVTTDRATAERIEAQNEYGRRQCALARRLSRAD